MPGCSLCRPGIRKSASVKYESISYPRKWTDPWKDEDKLNGAETDILLPLVSVDFDSDFDESYPEILSKYLACKLISYYIEIIIDVVKMKIKR